MVGGECLPAGGPPGSGPCFVPNDAFAWPVPSPSLHRCGTQTDHVMSLVGYDAFPPAGQGSCVEVPVDACVGVPVGTLFGMVASPSSQLFALKWNSVCIPVVVGESAVPWPSDRSRLQLLRRSSSAYLLTDSPQLIKSSLSSQRSKLSRRGFKADQRNDNQISEFKEAFSLFNKDGNVNIINYPTAPCLSLISLDRRSLAVFSGSQASDAASIPASTSADGGCRLSTLPTPILTVYARVKLKNGRGGIVLTVVVHPSLASWSFRRVSLTIPSPDLGGPRRSEMDEVVQAVADLKKEWEQTSVQVRERVKAIEACGNSGRGTEEASSLPRLNGAAQDGLALLRSMQFKLDLLAPQLPTFKESQSEQATLNSWKDEYQSLHLGLRNANFQAKANIRRVVQEERELLFGGGEESTVRRRNLQTKAGMTSAAESITESLRRTRQLMVQVNFSSCPEQSTSVLKEAESEYKGLHFLLMRTRNLLTTMNHQDVMDR
ncbi:hypothetical protein J5N97_016280 [Dioscorea zingiberensis]|uniref:Sec20 C-terminal domain-containing protein n=1 Tax=Dioscorea zingiberensis TaxID=325984 RepID=A0A9D5CJQ3_9LILI|nr:hypothetical protein J5N97_016280 [Dioscorea zingiberensis]